jgi:hypothetical protein
VPWTDAAPHAGKSSIIRKVANVMLVNRFLPRRLCCSLVVEFKQEMQETFAHETKGVRVKSHLCTTFPEA